MAYRTKEVDPDYRRQAKTLCWCGLCQRDLAPTVKPLWIANELDNYTLLIHPADIEAAWHEIRARRSPHHFDCCVVFDRVGPECARKIGREWAFDQTAYDAARALGIKPILQEIE